MHATTLYTQFKPRFWPRANYSQVLFLVFGLFFLSLSSPSFAQTNDAEITHVVKKGENLFRISKKYGTTVNELVALNNLSASNMIYVDQQLRINQANSLDNSASYRGSAPPRIYYTWEQKDETSISNKRESQVNKGAERGRAASQNSTTQRNSRESYLKSQLSPAKATIPQQSATYRQSSVAYTYGYGYDRYNWTDEESYLVGNADPEVLDIVDGLDELRSGLTYNRYGKRVRAVEAIPTRSDHQRVTYRGDESATNPSFRRAKGAIDDPYYKEKVRLRLAGKVYHYRVKKGDSILSIAVEQGTSTDEIIELNDLEDYDLRVGRILQLVKS